MPIRYPPRREPRVLAVSLTPKYVAFAVVDPWVGFAAALGCVIGILVGPDLDQIDQVIIHHGERQLIRYLPIVGYLWIALWDPYARVCRHRHVLSHFPVVGTAGRIAYIYIWFRVFNVTWPLPLEMTAGLAMGLLASDILHWAMDGGPIYMDWGRKEVRIRCLSFLSAWGFGSPA